MMKLISHFLALLLATVLSLAVSGWILEQTLWSATYLERQADQTKLYPNLADSLPKSFAAADPTDTAAGLPVADPALLQSQISALLPQVIEHLHKSGPVPIVDLAALAAAVGQPVPDGTTTQPLTLGPADAKLATMGQDLHTASQFAPLAAIALILLIVGVMRDHRVPTLIRAALETAAALGFSAGLLWISPSLLLNALSKPTLTPIRDAISPFVASTCHSIAMQFGIAAIIFLVISIGLWLTHRALRLKDRFMPKPKAAPPTDLRSSER